jgi:PAS domain S-box-containing protein
MDRPFSANLVAFLDQTLEAVVGVDDRRHFVYANDATVHLFGASRTEILSLRVDDLLRVPGSSVQDAWDQFLATGRFRGRVTLLRPDGVHRELEATATAHWRPGLHVGFCRDVTERALAERRLATQFEIAQSLSEAGSITEAAPRLLGALAFALDAAAGALWVVDRGANVMRCAGSWSPRVAPELGQAQAQPLQRGEGLPGRVWAAGRMEHVGDLEREPSSPRVAAVLGAGLRTACAFPIFGAFGVVGVAELFGAALEPPDDEHLDMMTAACGQLSQFFERRRSESQLLITGRLGWFMPVGLSVWRLERIGDPTSLRLVATNPALKRFTLGEWPVGALIGDLLPGIFGTSVPDVLATVIESGTPADLHEVPSLLHPGRLISLRVIPLPDFSVGVLVEDVTERRQVERQLLMYTGNLEAEVNARIARIKELEAEHARGEKLAAAGRLAARVAHEIINPLASIKNAFALVKEGVRPDFAHAHYVPRIEHEIDRIARIVGQMRELYRPITEPVVECDVVALVQDLVGLIEPEAAYRGIVVRLRASEWPLYAPVQQDGLRQILYNLLRNAIDASPDGGAIEVVVECGDGEVRLLVADQGSGVADDVAEHIFEPFFTTKNSGNGHSGLGLGLSIAQGLATAMHGSLTLLRGTARGAAFRVALPRRTQELASLTG